jgi:hypothetical protein
MSPFKEVTIKRKRATGKLPKKVFLYVDENGEVRLKIGIWLQKTVGKRAKLLVDDIAGSIAIQGADKKDNSLSTNGIFFNISDAIEALQLNLPEFTDTWYEVPIEIALTGRRIVLRMRKADRLKEPPPMRANRQKKVK